MLEFSHKLTAKHVVEIRFLSSLTNFKDVFVRISSFIASAAGSSISFSLRSKYSRLRLFCKARVNVLRLSNDESPFLGIESFLRNSLSWRPTPRKLIPLEVIRWPVNSSSFKKR